MELYDGSRYYHRIPGLLVPRNNKAIRHEQTHSDINRFIDTVPGLTETMEDNFVNIDKRYFQFTNDMEMMVLLLSKVYARGLESDANRILRLGKDGQNLTLARKMMKPFIRDVLSLSVAMQKAQSFTNGEKEETISEIEIHADMARNILTVYNLFDDEDYENARVMIEKLTEHDPEETAYLKLSNLLATQKYDEAKTTVHDLREKHIEAINQLVGTDLSKKILAVDDMPEVLSFIRNALKNHYKVFGVTDANAAVKVMAVQKPDLFILDIDMPEIDGYEIAEGIRADADYAKTPIIFLTGNSSREHVLRAIEVGGNDFLVKPTSHDNLLTKVGKYLFNN